VIDVPAPHGVTFNLEAICVAAETTLARTPSTDDLYDHAKNSRRSTTPTLPSSPGLSSQGHRGGPGAAEGARIEIDAIVAMAAPA
jgi:hypothetical protein